MFSDSYPIKVVDGVMYEVTGKVILFFWSVSHLLDAKHHMIEHLNQFMIVYFYFSTFRLNTEISS